MRRSIYIGGVYFFILYKGVVGASDGYLFLLFFKKNIYREVGYKVYGVWFGLWTVNLGWRKYLILYCI